MTPVLVDLLDKLAALSIDNVKSAVRLIADVDARSIGGKIDSVGGLNPFDLLHDLVRCGINDMDAVPGGVRNIDPDRIRSNGRCCECKQE
jgi:hypothetical protein